MTTWQHWVNAVLGLWVLAIPFLGFTGDTLTWTLAVTGIVIAALAVWGALNNSQTTTANRSTNRLQHQ
jgi:hypothetical protein